MCRHCGKSAWSLTQHYLWTLQLYERSRPSPLWEVYKCVKVEYLSRTSTTQSGCIDESYATTISRCSESSHTSRRDRSIARVSKGKCYWLFRAITVTLKWGGIMFCLGYPSVWLTRVIERVVSLFLVVFVLISLFYL